MINAKMFHITPEGGWLRRGFNFFPWSERKWSIGFRWFGGNTPDGDAKVWWLRYAPHVRMIYVGHRGLRLA